ncbi:MAG: hypothetical protein IT548_14440 [Alphaproteobacteria bacterium]|nr:hypothetical protein [Alphaproteobacteria bacterium]
MRKRTLAIIFAAAFAAPAFGGGGDEEIVVTAQRAQYSDYSDTPHVSLARRADNIITTVTVVCDTRDEKQREQELRDTLRSLISAASREGSITLSVGDDILVDFNDTMLDKVIIPDTEKTETSKASIVVKTAIRPEDTFDSATGRIKSFVDATEKVGRSEVLVSGSFNLSIVGPEKSRPELLRLIADDARATAATFGQNYEVTLDGLQNQIQWYQSGQLELSLFLYYKMSVKAAQP